MAGSRAQIPATRRPRALRPSRGGFTLTEIMLSLGILCIGLVMVAAAFHAGILRHDETVDGILRTAVGENATAVAKARLRHAAGPGTSSPYYIGTALTFLCGSTQTAGPSKALVGSRDLMYPVNVARGRGYLLLGHRVLPARNEYQLKVLPYVCDDPNYHIEVVMDKQRDVSVTTYQGQMRSQVRGDDAVSVKIDFPVGSDVIMLRDATGEVLMAKVAGYNGRNAVLDKLLSTGMLKLAIVKLKLKDQAGNGPPAGATVQYEVASLDEAYEARTALTPAQE